MSRIDLASWDIAPFLPEHDPDHLPAPHSGDYINFGYVRQYMRQVQENNADLVPSGRFELAYPPHVLKSLREIDWTSSDFALAFALTSRLIWIWMLRNEQIAARVHLYGDSSAYSNVENALRLLVVEPSACWTLAGSFHILVPKRLPPPDEDTFHDQDIQQRIVLDLGMMLKDIARSAREYGKAYQFPGITPALYPYDREFYDYRSRVRAILKQESRPVGLGIREYDDDHDVPRAPMVAPSFRFRKRRRACTLSFVAHAAQRLVKLWNAYETSGLARQPTSEEQAAYVTEWNVIVDILELNKRKYGNLRFRFHSQVPVYLHHSPTVRSSSAIPFAPVDRITMFLDEVKRTAFQMNESMLAIPGGAELETWYPSWQEARYTLVLRSFMNQPPKSNQTVPDMATTSVDAPQSEADDLGPNTASPTSQQSSRGRHAVTLEYDVAREMWWNLVDEMAPRKPTQAILCDRLTDLGYPIAVRTFGEKCKNWRLQGLAWPGARPDDTPIPA